MVRPQVCAILCVLSCAGPADQSTAPATVPSSPGTATTTGASITTTPQPTAPPANVLMILIDDVGLDKVKSYHPELSGLPAQPTLDRLANDGMRFEHAYAQPVCSPTRAELMTGRHSRRYGLGRYIPSTDAYEVPLDEWMLPEMLAQAPDTWATAAFGKWHLTGSSSPNHGVHPNLNGFEHYSGKPNNPMSVEAYFSGDKFVNGVVVPYDTYLTTDTIDDAIQWIDQAPEPWFAYVATHAAHEPIHSPPDDLHTVATMVDEPDVYSGMLEAVDTELDRLLASIDPDMLANTNVIVMGDNGTYESVIEAPFDPARSKGSSYEGGMRVPMLVVGPAVQTPGSVSQELVQVTDWMPTVADWAGLDRSALDAAAPAPIDGKSLAGVIGAGDTGPNATLYADKFLPLGGPPYMPDLRTVRNERWKLRAALVDGADVLELYDLDLFDYDEGDPIDMSTATADQQAAWDHLVAELDRYATDLVYEGEGASTTTP